MDPFLLTVSPDFLHKRSESGDRVETLARTSVDSYEALPGCLIAHFFPAEERFVSQPR